VKKLLGRFKQAIQNLRMGTVSEGIEIKFCLNDEDGTAFVRTTMNCCCRIGKSVPPLSGIGLNTTPMRVPKNFIRFIETPKVVLDVLCPAFEQSRIKVILFCGSGHPGDTADFARKVLQMNHFLTEIALLRSCSLMRI